MRIPVEELAAVHHDEESVRVLQQFLHHRTVTVENSESISHASSDAQGRSGDEVLEIRRTRHQVDNHLLRLQVLIGNVATSPVDIQELVVQLTFHLPQ